MNDNSVLGATAIDKIADLAREGTAPHTLEIEGKTYYRNTREGTLVELVHRLPPVKELKVHSLDAIADYLNSNKDLHDLGEITVHVEDEKTVSIIGPLLGSEFANDEQTPSNQRFTYVRAEARERVQFPVGQWLSQDDFIVALATCMVPTEIRAEVIRVCGNVTGSTSLNLQDDGLSQEVNVRAHLELAGRAELPNSIALSPYRTFPQINQPDSLYVLRAKLVDVGKQGEKEQKVIRFALYEADGGAWRDKAAEWIKLYLREKIDSEEVAIIG